MAEKRYHETLLERAKKAAGSSGTNVDVAAMIDGLTTPAEVVARLRSAFLTFCELGQDKKAAEVLAWLSLAAKEELFWPHTSDAGKGRRLVDDFPVFSFEDATAVEKHSAVKMASLAADLWLEATRIVASVRRESQHLDSYLVLPESRRLLARLIVIGWREAKDEEEAKVCLINLKKICLEELKRLTSDVVIVAIREEATLSRQRFLDFLLLWHDLFKGERLVSRLAGVVFEAVAMNFVVSLSDEAAQVADIFRPFGNRKMSETSSSFLCEQSAAAAEVDRAVADIEKVCKLRLTGHGCGVTITILAPRRFVIKHEATNLLTHACDPQLIGNQNFEAEREKMMVWLGSNPSWVIDYEFVLASRCIGGGNHFERRETLRA